MSTGRAGLACRNLVDGTPISRRKLAQRTRHDPPPMAAMLGSACNGFVSPFKRYVSAWLAAVLYVIVLSGARLGSFQGSALGPLHMGRDKNV